MADDNKLEVPVTADTKQFDDAIDKSAKKAGETFQKNTTGKVLTPEAGKKSAEGFLSSVKDEISNRIPLIGPILTNPIAGAFAAAGAIGAKVVHDIFEGEAIKKIEKNFDNVTRSFNVAGDQILGTFMKATNGMVDNTDVMKALTANTVAFNGEIDKLPELYALARKAGNAFGRDSMEVFDSLAFAARTGNTRAIRFLFPKLDLEKEYDRYAVANRILAKDLTETQRQQVALNLILSEGQKRLSGVSEETDTLTAEWTKLKVAYANMREEQQKATADGFFSGILKSTIKDFREHIEQVNDPRNTYGIHNLSQAYAKQEYSVERLKKAEEEYSKTQDARLNGTIAYYKDQLRTIELTIEQMKKQQEIANSMPQLDFLKPSFNRPSIVPSIYAPGMTDKEKAAEKVEDEQKKNRLEANRDFLKRYNQEEQSSKLALLQDAYNNNKSIENITALHTQTMLGLEQERKDKINGIGKDMLSKGLITKEELLSGEYKKTQEYKDAELAINNQYNNKFSKQMNDFTRNFDENQKKLKSITQTGFLNTLVGGFTALGAAMAKGENGFEAFGKAVISSLGSIAIQMGSMLIQIGLGFQTMGPIMPVWGLSGASAVAAGIGLVALGGAMQGVGGGASASTGGGVTGGSYDSNPNSALTQNTPTQEKQTGINVIVQGNVFDMEATGKNIADTISNAFQNQGVRIYA